MKEKILVLISLVLTLGIGFMVGQIIFINNQKPNQLVQKIIDRSLDKYSIDNLQKAILPGSEIEIVKSLKDFPEFTSSEFVMEFSPNLDSRTARKVSGMINTPKAKGKHPLIVLIRGFVPLDQYFTGNGTINSSYFFAKSGFITIAPDFLGYGESDPEPSGVFEARFQTYTTMLSLLNAIKTNTRDNPLKDLWDGKNIEIWAHSNGGQIALTTLEVTKENYPTVLWAPVSSSFPFSILYYSVDADDHGKFLRKELGRFEDVYDTEAYSLTNFLTSITAPIQLNQGSADEAVPVSWNDNLAKTLKKQNLKVNYHVYQGLDHQMNPLWNTVIQKDLEFFRGNLK